MRRKDFFCSEAKKLKKKRRKLPSVCIVTIKLNGHCIAGCNVRARALDKCDKETDNNKNMEIAEQTQLLLIKSTHFYGLV